MRVAFAAVLITSTVLLALTSVASAQSGSGSGSGSGFPSSGSGSGFGSGSGSAPPPPGSGSGSGSDGSGSNAVGGSDSGSDSGFGASPPPYPSSSSVPTPSFTPGPTPWLDACGVAMLNVVKCHRQGPLAVDPFYQGPQWEVPDLEAISPFSACCFAVDAMLSQCYGGVSGVLYDWSQIVGANVLRSEIIEAYMFSCPTAPRSACVNATLELSQCVRDNRDILAAAPPPDNSTQGPVLNDCCALATNIGTVCQGWNSIAEGRYGAIMTSIPTDTYTEVNSLLAQCALFPKSTCEKALSRVTSCMVANGGIANFDYGDDLSTPMWGASNMAYTPCCAQVPLVYTVCQGHNIPFIVAEQNTYSSVTPATVAEPNRRSIAVNSMLNQCAPDYYGRRVRTSCDDIIYGVHVWNGHLISLQCNSQYAQQQGCTPIYINRKAYYIVRPDVPAGFVERTECSAVPV